MKILFLTIVLSFPLMSHAAIVVKVDDPKTVGTKSVIKLTLKNTFKEKVESARAQIFLFDNQGKVVGQSAQCVIGCTKDKPPLSVGGTNTYHFVVSTSGKAFVTNRLTVTHVKLANGKTANPVTDVEVLFGPMH